MSPIPDVTPAPEVMVAPVRARPPWLGPARRVVGLLVATLLGGVSAVYEVFYSDLYWGHLRVPVSVVAALAVNLGLVWFTHEVTGRRLAVVAPALLWTAVMVTAATRTTEGDLVLTGSNWVALTTMLVGSVAFAAGAYRLILAGARPPRSAPDQRAH